MSFLTLTGIVEVNTLLVAEARTCFQPRAKYFALPPLPFPFGFKIFGISHHLTHLDKGMQARVSMSTRSGVKVPSFMESK